MISWPSQGIHLLPSLATISTPYPPIRFKQLLTSLKIPEIQRHGPPFLPSTLFPPSSDNLNPRSDESDEPNAVHSGGDECHSWWRLDNEMDVRGEILELKEAVIRR
jgi:hypothetical protein